VPTRYGLEASDKAPLDGPEPSELAYGAHSAPILRAAKPPMARLQPSEWTTGSGDQSAQPKACPPEPSVRDTSLGGQLLDPHHGWPP
jgi:hypothetical protein